jgi:hypothetical protein
LGPDRTFGFRIGHDSATVGNSTSSGNRTTGPGFSWQDFYGEDFHGQEDGRQARP